MRRASVEMQDALHLDAWSRSSSRSLHVKIYRSWKPQPWIYRFLSIPRRGKDPNHPRWQTMLGYKYRVTLGMMEKFATFELLSLSWSVDGVCRLILGLILEVEILRGKLNTGLESDFFFFLSPFLSFSSCFPYATLTVMTDLELPDWTHGSRFQLYCESDEVTGGEYWWIDPLVIFL